MSTPTSIFKHPTHAMLIVFPLGLWCFSLIAQIIYMYNHAEAWSIVALYTLGGGIIGALAAAIPGIIDLLALPPSRTKTLGWWHAGVNITVLLILSCAFYLRWQGMHDQLAFYLMAGGIMLLSVGGWLGGQLVYVHGVGVDVAAQERSTERLEEKRRDMESQEARRRQILTEHQHPRKGTA